MNLYEIEEMIDSEQDLTDSDSNSFACEDF